MVFFDTGTVRFSFRIAAVCYHQGHVLLQRADRDASWSLPGGHPELREPSRETLVRELREEIDVEARVGRLLWVVENFFDLGGHSYHQLCLFYEATLPAGAGQLDVEREFAGVSGLDYALVFRWFPVDQLPAVNLYPAFLRTALARPPATPEHVVVPPT